MQTGLAFTDDGVYGTLKHVTGYTGFSGDASEQSGNYMAFRIDTDDENDVITVELLGGTVGHPVTLDSDRNMVIRVGNPLRQKLRVVVTHTNEDESVSTVTKTYRMADLTLLS